MRIDYYLNKISFLLFLVYGNPYLRSSTALDTNNFYNDYGGSTAVGGRNSIGGFTPPLHSNTANMHSTNDYCYSTAAGGGINADYLGNGGNLLNGGLGMRPATNLVSTEYVMRNDILGSNLATHV